MILKPGKPESHEKDPSAAEIMTAYCSFQSDGTCL